MFSSFLRVFKYFRLLGRKFLESWTSCIVMLSNGDLTGISHQHLIGASKTGAFTGVAMVIAYLSFRRKLDTIYIKYLAIILTGVFACLGEHIARLTDTSAWPDGVDLQKSFLVGLGAAFIAFITEKYLLTGFEK